GHTKSCGCLQRKVTNERIEKARANGELFKPQRRPRRGPRRSAVTQEVYTACYDLLAAGKSRRIVLKILPKLFPEQKYADTIPKEESHVTIYARRRAQDPEDPRPWPIPGKRA